MDFQDVLWKVTAMGSGFLWGGDVITHNLRKSSHFDFLNPVQKRIQDSPGDVNPNGGGANLLFSQNFPKLEKIKEIFTS